MFLMGGTKGYLTWLMLNTEKNTLPGKAAASPQFPQLPAAPHRKTHFASGVTFIALCFRVAGATENQNSLEKSNRNRKNCKTFYTQKV